MAQIGTIVTDALLEIGVVSSIEEAAPQDHAFALRKLNRIISLYNTENTITTYIYHKELDKPVDGWTSPIELGTGLQFDMTPPTDIEKIYFTEAGTSYSMRMMSQTQWADISYKNTTAIPRRYYFEKQPNNTAKIYFDVLPQDNLGLKIICKMPMNNGLEFVATDEVTFSHGVEKLLIDRLALELCGPFEITDTRVISMLVAKVQDGEMNVHRNNKKMYTMKTRLSRNGRVRAKVTNRAMS